jgi:hypothetical protein
VKPKSGRSGAKRSIVKSSKMTRIVSAATAIYLKLPDLLDKIAAKALGWQPTASQV